MNDERNLHDRPHVKVDSVKYTKGFGVKLFFERLTKVVIGVVFITAIGGVFYTYAKEPIKTSDGYEHAEVVRRMYRVGEEVLVVINPNPNPLTPLLNAVTEQEVKYMKIVAGPYGEVQYNEADGTFTAIHGEDVARVNIDRDKSFFLDKKYIVRELGTGNNEDNFSEGEVGNEELVSNEFDLVAVPGEIVGILK